MQSRPFETTAIDAYPSKQAWDAAAADLVATMLSRWELVATTAIAGGEAGSVLRVTTAAGEPAVLKLGFPHVEAVWEAVGLEGWGPPLAPRVLRQDPWTWAMLLELVEPGIPLSRSPLPAEEALSAGAALYSRLAGRAVPEGIPRLEQAMRPFLDTAVAALPRHGTELGADAPLLEAGLAELDSLLDGTGDAFLHGDYNPGNVLSASEGRWVAIDPKPMRGDPAFDLWPLVGQLGPVWGDAHPEGVLAGQLELAASVAGVDMARAARWGFARSALNISWYLDDGDATSAATAAREARAWAALAP